MQSATSRVTRGTRLAHETFVGAYFQMLIGQQFASAVSQRRDSVPTCQQVGGGVELKTNTSVASESHRPLLRGIAAVLTHMRATLAH